MQMKSYFAAYSLLAFSTLINGMPLEDRSAPNICSAVNPIVSILHAWSPATTFCSSFLHISTQTFSTTYTATAFTTTTSTVVTGTEIVTAATSTITASTSTVVTTTVIPFTTCISTAVARRDNHAPKHERGLTTKCTSTTAKSSSVQLSTKKMSTTSSSSTTSTIKPSSSSTTTTSKPTSSSTTTTSKTSSTSSTGLPSCISGFASSAVSTACSCLSIPTPSVTITSSTTTTSTLVSTSNIAATSTSTPLTTFTPVTTSTATSTSTSIVCPTPDLSCSNQGVQWAIYENNQGDNNDPPYYSQFDPTVYKSQVPEYNDVTGSAGGIDIPSGSPPTTIYGSSMTFPINYFVLNHRGYLYAPQTGTYTISLLGADDAAWVWLGSAAYSGWNRDNANDFASLDQGISSVFLVEDTYTPLRIVFAQAQGDASFQLQISAPDGTVLLAAGSNYSPYIVQYSCDGIAAPQYPPFGQET